MALNKITAKSSRRRFDRDKYSVFSDVHGNVQHCRAGRHASAAPTIDSLVALTCEGKKSARHANSMCRFDLGSELDSLFETYGGGLD